MTAIVGLIPIRRGTIPLGGLEVAAEATAGSWLIGTGHDEAVDELCKLVGPLTWVEAGDFQPSRWATDLAALVPGDHHLLLPHSPDGRDLAPRLAAALDRPLVAGATEIIGDRATVARQGGLTMTTLALGEPVVATLQIGVRSVDPSDRIDQADVARHALPNPSQSGRSLSDEPICDPILIEEIPADPATMDLAEAPRIVAGGAGLGTSESFDELHLVAQQLHASTGATRVVTDWGWAPVERQIGTTGVIVDPDLYLAVGISGAVQHTAGLGAPDHLIAVNTDASCPMMTLADLAIVCDGPAFVTALAELLSRRS